MAIHIGISGWRYAPWRGVFYPSGLPQRRELEYAAHSFASIEINGSFYSLQSPRSWSTWAAQVPPRFVFAVKGPRYVTHILRLRAVETALANFFAPGVLLLGQHLGPLLWQLPPNLRYSAEELEAFLTLLHAIPMPPWPSHAATSPGAWPDAAPCHPSPTGHCGMPWKYATRASATRRWSSSCVATAWPWWWPIPPASIRIWRT